MARVTLRLPDDLHSVVRKISDEQGISLNELIVDAVETAVKCRQPADSEIDSKAARVERLRAALGDMVVLVDPNDFPPEVRPNASMRDRDVLFRSLPVLDPPLSATIIEEREDRF